MRYEVTEIFSFRINFGGFAKATATRVVNNSSSWKYNAGNELFNAGLLVDKTVSVIMRLTRVPAIIVGVRDKWKQRTTIGWH